MDKKQKQEARAFFREETDPFATKFCPLLI